jgi:hypothetical protein
MINLHDVSEMDAKTQNTKVNEPMRLDNLDEKEEKKKKKKREEKIVLEEEQEVMIARMEKEAKEIK